MMLNTIFNKIKRTIQFTKENKNLDGNGERVDISYKKNINIDVLDMYQKSHYYRYQFARKFINADDVCGDFACGTGYGSVMLSEKSKKVIGADLNTEVINEIKERYKKITNVQFVNADLLEINYKTIFDKIISFETIEHFHEDKILELFKLYANALKPGGKIIFSTPYMQEPTEAAVKMGFHFTFKIDEQKIELWLKKAGFKIDFYKYQNYQTHVIQDNLDHKDFIICMASI